MTTKTPSIVPAFNPMSMWAQKPSIMKPVTAPAVSTVSGPDTFSMWNQRSAPATPAVAKESNPVPVTVEPAREATVAVDPIIQSSVAVLLTPDSTDVVTVEASPPMPMSDHATEIRRRGPPAIPSFTTTPAALSFSQPPRKLSSLRR